MAFCFPKNPIHKNGAWTFGAIPDHCQMSIKVLLRDILVQHAGFICRYHILDINEGVVTTVSLEGF